MLVTLCLVLCVTTHRVLCALLSHTFSQVVVMDEGQQPQHKLDVMKQTNLNQEHRGIPHSYKGETVRLVRVAEAELIVSNRFFVLQSPIRCPP